MSDNKTTANTHIYRDEPVIPCEQKILTQFTQPGMKVLDIGCAASGRSARKLRDFGCEVTAIEINANATLEFGARTDSKDIALTVADACELPFQDACFDLVIAALHGLDYVLPNAKRITAIREIDRVLNDKGIFVFDTMNPIGVITSPKGLFVARYFKWRLQQILSLGFLKHSLFDYHNIEMHQALPSKVIQQVEDVTDMKFFYVMNKRGTVKNRMLITLFSSGPYYVFSKAGSG